MSEECALLTTRQAAARLGLSPRTLERYRVTGEGPEFFKMGHAVRYTASMLNRWLAGCARKSTSDRGRASGRQRARRSAHDRGGATASDRKRARRGASRDKAGEQE